MDRQRVEKLKAILHDRRNAVGEQAARKLDLEKGNRIIERLSSFSDECEECNQHFIDLETHIIQLGESLDPLEESNVKHHKQLIDNSSAHLTKQHKLVTSGYYLGIYMSIGISLGVVFGLLLFDNIALGIPIGVGVGVAIGAGLDEDAKKKGRTL